MSEGDMGLIPEFTIFPFIRIRGASPFAIFIDDVFASDIISGISCKAINGLLIFLAEDDR